jgi:hypothetical protein
MSKHITVFIAVDIIGFAVNETILAAAQSNSTNLDKRNIVVTWLETNDTKPIDAPMISISDDDFWMVFEPLLEQSINRSTDSS